MTIAADLDVKHRTKKIKKSSCSTVGNIQSTVKNVLSGHLRIDKKQS